MFTTNIIEHELGHLRIYKKVTILHPFGDGKLYYNDARDINQSEVGPFTSISQAVEHWGAYMVPQVVPNPMAIGKQHYFVDTPKPIEPPLPNNVIYVDFQTRKRR